MMRVLPCDEPRSWTGQNCSKPATRCPRWARCAATALPMPPKPTTITSYMVVKRSSRTAFDGTIRIDFFTPKSDDKPMSMVETDARWQAFMARDKNADGRFVVGVHSTKIYCRPSCPARHPKPQNVAFFPSAGEARARGYRACLRCQPDQPAAKSRELVQRVCRYIDEHDDATPDLRTLGRHAGVSPSHLQRVFKALIGITPKEYSVARRMQRLKQRLKKGEAVTSALYAAGFGSSSRLYENGDAHLGMTPGKYRRAGTGSRLHYTTVDTMLGRMLVACTPRGVSEVRFGESDAALEKALRQDYHRAEIARDDAALQAVVKKSSHTWTAARRWTASPWTSVLRLFNIESGRRCARSHTGKLAPMARSRR